MDFCHFPLVCSRINHLGDNSCSHQKFATRGEMGFTKCPLQVKLFLLPLAAKMQVKNDIKDLLCGVRPGGTADLEFPSLDETTMNSN